MPAIDTENWKWENAAAGAVAGFATVAALHPLDVVRTRFQVTDGRVTNLPLYKNTAHAIYTIARTEGLRGLYAGFYPAVFGSTLSWGLYFFFYSRAKHRYCKGNDRQLSPGYHLVSAAEAGALVCLCTNPIWLVKTRLQLQTSQHYQPYSGFSDALRTILKEEGWRALYKGIGPGLLLNSFDYATLGASSKIGAILLTYPYQVIRARLQQRPGSDGIPKFRDSWHVVRETARFEGIRGFYRGITSNLLKNIPAASITFVVYENVLKLLRIAQGQN
ncbi:folate transporter 1, chloroplastic isoform X2 [Phoenix dactylifera]|uniref:Folate transporter 1, chloroplastic isoform X2 n=1 Tax=Phoenix dactylifera TaxID=42345 RepID=A0A8B7D3F1_PHODC|nr:folate transporter 1, chloroplastic isoform X2 [Phoenix dactylifera]